MFWTVEELGPLARPDAAEHRITWLSQHVRNEPICCSTFLKFGIGNLSSSRIMFPKKWLFSGGN